MIILMNMEPILSIIIPSYNTAKYVDECVPTFIDERLLDKVVIYFIDDGATDNTKEVLQKYIDQYPNYFHFIHKENGGHGSVINYGVYQLIKTKYFKVIDGDDWVDTNNLVELVDFLYTQDTDLIISDYMEKYPGRDVYIKALSQDNPDYFHGYKLTIHSITYKTEIYKRSNIQLTEKCFYEDNEYRLFPLVNVHSLSYFNKPVYLYRLGNANQSVSIQSFVKNISHLKTIIQSIKHFYQTTILKSEDDNLNRFSLYVLANLYLSELNYLDAIKAKRKSYLDLCGEIKEIDGLLERISKRKYFRFLSFLNFRFLPLKRFIIKHF